MANYRADLRLSDDLRSWKGQIDAWTEMLTDIGLQTNVMKLHLYNAVSQSRHAAQLEPFLITTGLDFNAYKEKLYEALDGLLEDDMAILYNPIEADVMRAYYVAIKAAPNATEKKILKMIERHLPDHYYSILSNTTSATITVDSTNSTLRSKLLDYEARNRRVLIY